MLIARLSVTPAISCQMPPLSRNYTKQQMPCANLKEDEAVENHRIGLLLCMRQIPGMLVSATAVQGMELLVSLAIGRVGRV